MQRSTLTLRELADMRDASRDTIKYLDRGFRELIEQRHVFKDDDEKDDFGDMLLGSKGA